MQFGPYSIEISHRDKEFFPSSKQTKGDLLDYYLAIADALIPHLRHYGLAMQRYPDGIEAEGFFQKDCPDYFPEWLETTRIPKRDGGSFNAPVITNRAGLAYLVNQAMLTPHLYLSRRDNLESPDRMVFDLDPPDNAQESSPVNTAAIALYELLGELNLQSWVQTTGSNGFHLVVPLDRSADFDSVRTFSQDVALLLVQRYPQEYTLEQRKKKRQGRIFIDTQRNSYGATSVAPYAVRALPEAPVATPLFRDELMDAPEPRQWTISTVPGRLQKQGDPWAKIRRHAQSLKNRRKSLDRLLEETDPDR